MKYGYSYRQLQGKSGVGRPRRRRSLTGRILRVGLVAAILVAVGTSLLALMGDPPDPVEALALTQTLPADESEAMAATGTAPASVRPAPIEPLAPSLWESDPFSDPEIVDGPMHGPFLPPEFERNRASFIVSPGDTLTGLLDASGVQPNEARRLLSALGAHTDVNRVPLGARMELVLDGNRLPRELCYEPVPLQLFRGEQGEEGWRVGPETVSLEVRQDEVAGSVSDSLFESVQARSERADLAVALANIFAWEIDFTRETRPGDAFRLIVEKRYREGKFWDYGRILAAEYRGRATGTHRAFCLPSEEGAQGCYDGEGRSLRRAFLRAPLAFSRISSHYSKKRFHPILKAFRPHEGVDYAASVGTPVWSVAEGRVEFVGYKGGNGNMVIVHHPNGYRTYYNHLSRFARGLKKGSRVGQRRVVGYVGSTGLSTGPHLDYRIKYQGKFLDPLKINLPPGNPVSAERRGEFFAYRDLMSARLAAIDALAQAAAREPESGT